MRPGPSLDEVAAIIADLTALGVNAWLVIVAEPERLSAVTDDLREELEFHAREEGSSFTTIDADQLVAPEPPWPAAGVPRACLVRELELLSDAQLAQLDLDRGRFLDAPTIAIVTTPTGASRLAVHAPNLWSWVGSQCFVAVEPEPMNIASRVQSIRDELGISEEELIRRAEARSIALDAVLAEWLVLIGRGDLVGA